MKDKVIDLVDNWPGDEDNFVPGPRINPDDEFELESYCESQGFELNWTGNGYLVAIKHENN